MAWLGFSGAECNDWTLEKAFNGNVQGTATFSSTIKNNGAFSFACQSGAGNTNPFADIAFTGALGLADYGCTYLYLSNLPGSTVQVATFRTASADAISARLTAGGKLQLWNETGTPAQIGSDSALTLTTGVQYRIELACLVDTGSIDTAELRVATGGGVAVSVASGTSLAISDTALAQFRAGWNQAPGANLLCYVDDLAVNDSGWIGPHGVVLLVPTADSAVGANWQNGAAGTTNLFDAVNNLPPVGKLTASKTALTQIQHTGGANNSYDATMTTYTAAGVPAGATINFVQCVDADGEDIATGTKLLAFSIVSNPAVATSGNVTAGADAGACGTYPTLWTVHTGTLTLAPSVTLGTAPVMRVNRPETVSRLADVCFMGILVDFTPAAAVAFLAPPALVISQAVKRAAFY